MAIHLCLRLHLDEELLDGLDASAELLGCSHVFRASHEALADQQECHDPEGGQGLESKVSPFEQIVHGSRKAESEAERLLI